MALPQYIQLKELLKQQILGGIYRERDVLPSEHTLARTHGMARATVRQALDELVREGYILKEQGKGSIVQRRTLGLLSFHGFSEVARHQHYQAVTWNLSGPRRQDWPTPFFYSLSAKEQAAGCIYLQRLRSIGDDPVMLEHTYLPAAGMEELLRRPFVDGSLFTTLNRRYHIEIDRVEQETRAIPAAEETASLLQRPKGAPLLHIYRRYGTNREEWYVYSSLYCNTDKYSIGARFG